MNYTELVDAAKAYADRQDLEVSNNLDTFILLAEARINRVLKTREQSTRAFTDTVADQEYYVLPIDYAGMRDIQLNSDLPSVEHSNTPFDYISPYEFNKRRGEPYGGRLYYTVVANQLQIYPCQAAGLTIELVYYVKVPNLNATSISNWLSDSHPDIYLSGIIAEIEVFVKNYKVGQLWYKRMTTAIDELDMSDIEERWSGSPLYTRII